MAKNNFALLALRILGLEEVLKLSEILQEKQVPLKKVAGGDLVSWNDAVDKKPLRFRPEPEPAKILEFPKKAKDLEPYQTELTGHDPAEALMLEGVNDPVLWQREMSKNNANAISQLQALNGYKKATEMYVVKIPTPNGKAKITFVATAGVLVNKKQA